MKDRGAPPRSGSESIHRALAGLVLASIASGVAIALFARMQWPWLALGFVGLVPWLAALDRVATFGRSVLAGWLMSQAYVLCLFPWLPRALQDYSGAPRWSVVLAVVLSAPFIAPQFVALATMRHAARRLVAHLLPARQSAFAAVAGITAYLLIDGTMPKLMADTLGVALHGSPWLRQAADIAGVAGLTLLLLVTNELALVTVRAALRERRLATAVVAPASLALALVGAAAGYGALRGATFAESASGADPVTVGAVQAGLSHYDRMAATHGQLPTVRRILDEHIARSRDALDEASLDLLVWPETVYPLTYGQLPAAVASQFDARIDELVARSGVPLVLGTYDADAGAAYNAAIVLEPADGGARVAARYRKVRLFPLSEWTPPVLDTPRWRERWPWLGTWSSGPGPDALDVRLRDGRTLRIAPMICYDTALTEHAAEAVRQGATLLLTLSNDSWFAYGEAQSLLLAISAFRSIETRRPQVRVANTGISALIGADGSVRTGLGAGATGHLVGTVAPRHGDTLVLRHGDWLPRTAGCALLLLTGAGAVVRLRAQARKNRQAIQRGTPA